MSATMRDRFVAVTTDAMDSDHRLAVVLAEISATQFEPAHSRHPDRVINVGIREQLMIGVGAGLAIEGFRPVLHTYAPFLVERPFESLKTDLHHQGVGALLVSVGGSYDEPGYGRTHACPEDVALLDALTGWTVYLPGHADEVEPLLTAALASNDRVYLRLSTQTNALPRSVEPGQLEVLRKGGRGAVIAVGPMLDRTRAAVDDLDVSVLYATTLRPLDTATLRSVLDEPTVVVVEPLLAGTSAGVIDAALNDAPHRVLGIGVQDVDLHRYGTTADHDRAQQLDVAGIRSQLVDFFGA